MRIVCRLNRLQAGPAAMVAALLGALLLGGTPAMAGIGGSDTPTWPASAAVGDIIDTSVLIINTSTTPNNTESIQLTTLFVTPSCADSASPLCLGPNVDPGIFKVLPGTVFGDVSTPACAPGGVPIEFTVGVPDITTGEVALTPQSPVILDPTSGGTNISCLVNLRLRVFQVPTNPAPGPPVTTNALSRLTLVGVNSTLGGSGAGSAQIQISKGEVTLETTSNPNSNNVVPGTSVTDTVTVTKAPGAIPPTGSVRFILCQPNEVTGTGCPGGTGSAVPADKPLVGNSATSDPTNNTTTVGKYCWRARYLGDANYNVQNHTDATSECFTTVSAGCDITIDKSCFVESAYVCTKPITALTMQLDPASTLSPSTSNCVRIAGTAGASPATPFDIDLVCPGDVVTVGGYNGNQGNDVFWNVCAAESVGTCDSGNAAFIGQSSFHLSCSDVDMNTADDCGKSEGNNKGSTACLPGNNNASCINAWLLAGITGPAGSPQSASLVCPGFATQTNCTVSPAPYVCTKPITSLTMQWTGASAVRIAGVAGANPATPFDIDNIDPGDTVTVSGYNGNQGNDVFWNICTAGSGGTCDSGNADFIGQSSFHLSCSDVDMNSADDCGKLEGNNKGTTSCLPGNNNASCINLWVFEGMNGPIGSPPSASLDCANPNGTAPVTYTYVVTNNTATPVPGVSVTDAVTDVNGTTIVNICGPFDLGPNGTETCQVIDQIGLDTTNIATASTGSCSDDSNQVTVTVATAGTQCPTAAAALTTKDQNVTWNITAPASQGAEISKIEMTFPDATNGPLKQVHLAAPLIFSGSLASPATIVSFSGTANDRTVNKNKTEGLKFTFQNKPVDQTGYDITVTFTNGCSVHIVQ